MSSEALRAVASRARGLIDGTWPEGTAAEREPGATSPGDRAVPGFIPMLLAEAGPARLPLLFFTALSGAGMATLMAIVNTVADRPDQAGVHWELLFLFALSAVAVLAAQARALNVTMRVSEAMVDRLRTRLAALIRRADLDALETLGLNRVYSAVARHTAMLSEASATIIYASTSAVALFLAAVYIAYLSLLAFAVVVTLFAATVYFYRISQRTIRENLTRAAEAEATYFETFNHLLAGFKEVKMNAARGDDLERTVLTAQSRETFALRIEATRRMNVGLNISYASFYLLLATVALVLPQYVPTSQLAMKLIYTTIFMWATVEVVLRALPVLARANTAVTELVVIETQLAAATRAPEAPPVRAAPALRRIELRGVVYSYVGSDGQPLYTVGPCDLSVASGEMVFIVGGNGSGKSTLLRMLTRLYEPQAGLVLWDGRPVDRTNVAEYRNLFATVFSDFHLFDRLYGMRDVDPSRVRELLEVVDIASKTEFRDGRFSTLDLSTGQRRRLAFVVALLEDKPVYVLDELAADQDIGFRRRLYGELLPSLKAQGKALVLVTHDDRFFGAADRVLTMEDGRFVDEALR